MNIALSSCSERPARADIDPLLIACSDKLQPRVNALVVAARDYAATADAAEAALREAAQGATPLILGTIAYVGQGRTDKATETFRNVERITPKLVEARLSGRWLSSDPGYLARANTFFRVAAGLAPPEAADAPR